MRQYRKNINADYVFCFLRNFNVCDAIWILYLAFRGLSLWQIGVIEGIFHVASFLFEVPSGALADLLGRKNVMIAGRICAAIAAVIELFSTGFWGFVLGFIISALGYNLNSGSEEALVYDSLKADGEEAAYIKVNARLNIIIEIAQGAATFMGGMLAEISFFFCYFMAVVIALLSLVPACVMKEPVLFQREKTGRQQKAPKEKISLLSHGKACMEIIKNTKGVLAILIYYPIVETFYTASFFYGQEFFSREGFRKIEISLVMLLAGFCSCLGALCSEKLLAVFSEKLKYMVSIGIGLMIFGMGAAKPGTAVAALAASSFFMSMLYPIKSASLNARIPSGQRATILSVDSMFFSFCMAVLFPICGAAADRFSIRSMLVGMGSLQILLMILLFMGKSFKDGQNRI